MEYTALSLAASLDKQHDRTSVKEEDERKREYAHMTVCDIVLLDSCAHHDNRADGGGRPGDPLAF